MKHCLLTNVLSKPELFPKLSIKEMETVIRQANSCDLLASLTHRLKYNNIEISTLPRKVQQHLQAIQTVANAHEKFIQWEVKILETLFNQHNMPLILLKGAAYTAAELPSSKGRLYSDIDLLIDKNILAESELILKRGLWIAKEMDPYDEKYYRKWMHEIPPLYHVSRRSVLDVHHALLPETCKLRPDSDKLLENVTLIPETKNTYTLSPVDMVLHSMTHLFHEGELEHGLRDLLDINLLLTHYSQTDNTFWETLVPRAQELNLQFPLYYGLKYSAAILNTSIPSYVIAASKQNTPTLAKLMDFLFLRALLPNHKTCDSAFTGLARWTLYVRSHYLRMPLHLLIPHLMRKGNKRRNGKLDANN